MNDTIINSISTDKILPEPTFERVRENSNVMWKKIDANDFFRNALQVAVGVMALAIFTAVILPASLIFTAVSVVGLVALGLTSPALLHPGAAKVWRTVRDKIFGLLSDLVCLPKAVLITPLAFKPNVSRAQEKGDGKPLVVFVHGFLHNKTCWESLGKKLCKETRGSDHPIEHRNIYAINLGEPLTTEHIDHYARFLATKLEQIRIKRDLETLDVVVDCHSMGGLVAARFLTYAPLIGVNVIRLISNGTPWHGTPIAHVASIVDCGKEMTPDHTFQKGLVENINSIKNRVFTIASKGDTVVPYHSALGVELNIPEDHRLTLDLPYGHLAMLECEQGQVLNMRLIEEGICLHNRHLV